ncbi:alpha-amylase family protein [Lachnospiraceae bacterium 54-53]
MKYWYQKNLRFLQTVLREPDIIDYDAKAVVAYMKETNTNVLVVNAGGVIDFFKNPLPMSKENKFMKKGQDILSDVCREIHAAGMHVIVRVDFRGVEKERYEQHPYWFAKNADGSPKIVKYEKDFYSPCYLSHYSNEHAVEYIRYVMEHYDLDGIWENAVSFGTGICYCEKCRNRYLKDIGKELPVLKVNADRHSVMFDSTSEFFTPEFDEYRSWKAAIADEHIVRMKNATKSFGEDKAYSAEIFDLYNSVISKICSIGHDNAKRHFDYLISCVFMDAAFTQEQANRPYDIINNAGTTIRYSRALQETKQPVINTGGNGTRARYVCDPLIENRLWLWEIASVGGGIWNCYFNGQHPGATYDLRASQSEKDAYTFLADNSDIISDSRPVRDVAMFYSFANLEKFGNPIQSKDDFQAHFRGAERVLIENHIPYGFVIGGKYFSLSDLEGVKTLILPNAGILDDKEMEVIREYVRNGGGLVASFETSLYNEDGSKRPDYGLADVFGCHYNNESILTANDYYFKIKNPVSPVLKGILSTELLMNSGKTAICTADNKEEEVAGYLPEILNQPPEYAWIQPMDSPYAGIVARSFGKGRVVYFANTVDALCFTNGHEDFTEVYANAVNYTSRKEYTMETDAYRSVHTNLIEHIENETTTYILSFVNTTGTQQRPVKEIIAVGPFTASVPLNGRRLTDSSILWGEGRITADNETVIISVDCLKDFASIKLTVEQGGSNYVGSLDYCR